MPCCCKFSRAGLFAILVGVSTALLVGAGQSTQPDKKPAAKPEANHDHHAPAKPSLLDGLKPVIGEWECTMQGKTRTCLVSRLSSAGSAIVETMGPGTEFEMTNVYHMDADDLVVTHYCAAGNQPRMRCKGPKDGVYTFEFESATNAKPGQHVMSSLTITIKDNDHIVQHWKSTTDGKPTKDGEITFDLFRKKPAEAAATKPVEQPAPKHDHHPDKK